MTETKAKSENAAKRSDASGDYHASPSSDHLLGAVAGEYLRLRLSRRENKVDGAARFIIDVLSPGQTAAIAHGILDDAELATEFEIRMPRHFVQGLGLPDEVLTDERATYYRNSECDRLALLVANTGDDEQQSLSDLTPIGAPELQGQPALWVKVASRGLALNEDHRRWWECALAALQDLRFVSLDRYTSYVLHVRALIGDEGFTVLRALGRALPALHMPADMNYFSAIPDRARTHTSKWRSLYNAAHTKRACFLSKQTPTGSVLSEDDLRNAFNRVRTSIPDAVHPIVENFIQAPAGWTDAAAMLAQCEWEDVKPLFDGLHRVKFNLGQATLDFYGERDPALVSDEEREYLRLLIERKTTEAELDDDKQFYNDHRDELRDEPKLRSAWDKFVFGSPRESTDFLIGLADCLESYTWDATATKRRLQISCDRKFKRQLRDLNVEAGLYFAHRYNGLPELLGGAVSWDVGELFEFPTLVEQWRTAGKSINSSEAKSALQLKFVVELQVESGDRASESSPKQFIWRFDPQCVSCELANDWSRLTANPLVFCRVNCEPANAKGTVQAVSLRSVRTLMAAYGQDRGSLVGVYKKTNDIVLCWHANVKLAVERGWLSSETATELAQRFDAFAAAYRKAVVDFANAGLTAESAEESLQLYGTLLGDLCRLALGDRARQLVLRPVLELGTVRIEGRRPAAIVAPWHPLRMSALIQKARRLASLVRHLLSHQYIEFGDQRLFFRDLREELRHVFYPEVVLGWSGEKAELLALADVASDYSLHESPLAGDNGSDDTNENPVEGARQVVELVNRYLALQPHEQANLSIVLFNSDSSQLPLVVVDKLGAMNEDHDDARCQVILRHRDARQLRSLYEQIVEASGSEDDTFAASEITKDFMARLRIGIMADQAPAPDPRDGCPQDIVFSQDVIARHARLEWYVLSARPADIDLNPAQWSRRRPAAIGDMKSVVYLVCPVQRKEGWDFLTAIATFLTGDWNGDTLRRPLPARQLDFQDPTTAKIFEETHNLGAWVANYDELLDRRQLAEQHVRVIRYKQSVTQGRNLVVSSRAPLGLLRSMVLGRLRDLDLGIAEEELESAAERFIDDANDLSGDIVLRAAKRGRSASELIGLVLSRFLIRHELGRHQYAGWYFLDDYAGWLGQREEHIADLLALAPLDSASPPRRLAIVVSEAKYIDLSSLAAKRKESKKQLQDTLRRIGGAVLSPAVTDPTHPEVIARLDRNVWLAKLSDLLVDGVRFPAGASLDLGEWRRAIREASCDLEVRGYSHVFVSGPANSDDVSSCSPLTTPADGAPWDSYQEVFARDKVRRLVLRYLRDDDPTEDRRPVGGDGWGGSDGRRPGPQSIQIARTNSEGRQAPPSASAGSRPSTPAHNLGSSGRNESPAQQPTGVVPKPQVPVGPQGAAPAGATVQAGDAQLSSGTVKGGHRWAYAAVEHWLTRDAQEREDRGDSLAWLRQVEMLTKAALQQFQLQAKLLKSVLTPNAALLKFQGSAQLTVDQVLRHRSEFLTTHGLDLIGVQPEPGVVALSIARPRREMVSLRSLWTRWDPASGGNEDLLIGVREDDGGLLVLSPGRSHAPHVLIAGATGSGKSVLMQNIILSIVATNHPRDARIVLIDPKQGVDYFAFESLPHLDGGIIDKQDDALARINALVSEMDRRYSQLRRARVPNLRSYNAKVAFEERIPTLWFIHDEFAEWMLADDYKDHVADTVGRLGVKARAAGIHLIFAAQRPEASVMPMQLRANLGNRLVLRVDSEGTSEIALGEKGAERLLGKGHLLARLEGEKGLIYAQVPFASSEEIEDLVKAIEVAEHQ